MVDVAGKVRRPGIATLPLGSRVVDALRATGYEVDRLATQQQRLEARASDIRNELNRLGKAPAIRKLAIQSGLGPLPEPAVVPAR